MVQCTLNSINNGLTALWGDHRRIRLLRLSVLVGVWAIGRLSVSTTVSSATTEVHGAGDWVHPKVGKIFGIYG